MPPPDGGGGGGIGARRSGMTRNTPQLDAVVKWLNELESTKVFDVGGISELSQTKIKYGLEKYGRPVTKVTPYMKQRAVKAAQSYLEKTRRPTKSEFWNEVEKATLGVVIERIANAGGDLKSVWASHPLSPEYKARKAQQYPGKPMGQASGKLLSDLRSSKAFAVKSK